MRPLSITLVNFSSPSYIDRSTAIPSPLQCLAYPTDQYWPQPHQDRPSIFSHHRRRAEALRRLHRTCAPEQDQTHSKSTRCVQSKILALDFLGLLSVCGAVALSLGHDATQRLGGRDNGHHRRSWPSSARRHSRQSTASPCAGFVSGFMASFFRVMFPVSRPPLIIRLPVEEMCVSLDHKAVI